MSLRPLLLPFALFAILSSNQPLIAGMLQELDQKQIEALKRGETVVKSRPIDGKAWPELTLYRIVNAKPVQVLDLFTDYASAPQYTPGMLAAEVIAQPEKDVKDVRYTVKVPVLSKISYVVRNTFSQKGDTYTVSWTLLESPMASASTGSLTIEPYENKSLLRYQNHVTPSIPMAGALQGQALKEAKTTIEAIAAEAAKRAGNAK